MADGNFTVPTSTPEIFTRVRGEISESNGDVSVIRPSGEEVPAIKGTKIYLNDTISSRDDSAVVAYFGDAGVLVLGQNQQVPFTSDFFKNIDSLEQITSANTGAQNASAQPDGGFDLAALELAIQSGQNIEELLAPTAAGGATPNEDGASSAVTFYQRTADSMLPLSGFDPSAPAVEQVIPVVEIGDIDSNNQLNGANDALDDALTVNGVPTIDTASGSTQTENLARTGDTVATFVASDLDGDVITYSITSGNADGYFEIVGTTGVVTLTAMGAAALADDTLTDTTYTLGVTANDGVIDSPEATANILFDGVNDAPTLTINATGTLASDSTNTLTGSGALSFNDIDASDDVTVSVNANPSLSTSAGVGLPVGMEATLLAGFSVDQALGSWDYSTSADLDFLAAGETITLTYGVVAKDNSGAANDTSDVQTVIVTLTGTTDVLVSEDFEGVATAVGWSNNTITQTGGDATNFLGQFGRSRGQEAVSKDFFLGDQYAGETVTIKFDMYEIDSWDNESFNVFVNGGMVASDQYSWRDNPADGGTKLDDNIGNTTARWSRNDEVHAYEVEATVRSDGRVQLGFGSTLNQNLNDESYGIDNIEITAPGVTGVVTAPVAAKAFGDEDTVNTPELEVRTIVRGAARVLSDEPQEAESDDIFFGGTGDDTLIGGKGSDTFVFNSEAGIGSTDTIKDFSVVEGDVLNFADLLQDADNTTDLTNYLNVSLEGANTVITVDADGVGGYTDLTVILEGVDLTQGFDSGVAGVDQAALLQSLIDDNHLSVDSM